MRVGIDALSVKPGRTGGGETYVVSLLRALAGLDHGHELVVFALEGLRERLPQDPRMSFAETFPAAARVTVARRILAEQLWLPGETRRRALGAMLFVGNMMSLRCPCPSLLTIHDLMSSYYRERFPGALGTVRGALLPALVAASARRATRILAVSTFTRDEIVRRLGIAPAQIAVCPNGIGPATTASAEARRRAAELGPYVLFVGTKDHHKNIATLLDGFDRLRRRSAVRHRLVLAGMDGTASRELAPRIAALGTERVVDRGAVDDDTLAALYACASAFVFPSLYEGFGLPVLEAMRAAVPVAAARAGPIPEVAGDAALLFDPLDPGALAGALERLLTDPELAGALRERGLARAAPDGPFAWSRTARNVLAELEHLPPRQGPPPDTARTTKARSAS